MTHSSDAKGENERSQESGHTLNAAILRMSTSLDLDTVLREVVESARRLTGARYGIIATIDESGVPQEFVYSGFTSEEYRELGGWTGGIPLFEHLRDLPGPLRVADLAGYVHSLGIAPARMFSKTFQGTPMRHRGMDVGNFFLAEKADGEEFTDEDEEILTLLASQAAAAVVNARTYRSERRARADLEALIETSPVGIVVFDARSGRPVSINREAKRIVESLRMPGRPVEQLLEVISYRRADGREVALSEFPVAQQLCDAEAIRSEEVVLSMPDGRSVRTLLNVTPIRTEGDDIGSVVVTMQDLASLDEAERHRTEFLSLVSHELREPLTAIKGSAVTLLEESAELDPAEMREFHRIIVEQANHMRGLLSDLLDTGRIDSGTLSVAPEPSEVGALVERARNTFLSGGARHPILIDLPSDLPRVMADHRRIVQVLNNLFSNASRHSPESSPIRVSAARDGAHVEVAVSDQGRGVAPEWLPQLFRKHAGTGKDGTAGHGLGLAICKGLVEAHGGRIRAESAGAGLGTTVSFTIPVAREIGRATADAVPDPSATPRDETEATRILVVDDDPRTLRFVRDSLSAAGFAPLVTGGDQELSHIIRTEKPRLVLLDLMLPGVDGIELMQQVPELSDLPVIFISGYGRDETIAKALESGAADYIVKPFSPTELVARIRAALRRYEDPGPFALGELRIDYETRQVSVAGRTVDLTLTEYELLSVLSLNAGRVVTYDTLLRRIWSGRPSADSNLVRIFVRNLRRKLGDSAASPVYIFNLRGVGYRMANPGAER